MKIKLIIIDSHPAPPERDITYFVDTVSCAHIDRWRYSPHGAQKLIETVFCESDEEI